MFNPLKIISDAVSGIGSAISSVINAINAPDSEKAKLANEIESQLNGLKEKIINQNVELEKELTERLRIDMNSDSWLSKNIRPLTLIFLLVMFTVTSIPSIWNLNINQDFIDILKSWGVLAFTFYFGGRSGEKIIQTFKKYNIKNGE